MNSTPNSNYRSAILDGEAKRRMMAWSLPRLLGGLMLTATSAFAVQLNGEYSDDQEHYENARTYTFNGDRVEVTRRASLLTPAESFETSYKVEDGKVKISVGNGIYKILPLDKNGCLDQSSEGLRPACRGGCKVVAVFQSDVLPTFEGNCKKGKADGRGSYSFNRADRNGVVSVRVSGQFRDGLLNGEGIAEDETETSKGEFRDNRFWNGIRRVRIGDLKIGMRFREGQRVQPRCSGP